MLLEIIQHVAFIDEVLDKIVTIVADEIENTFSGDAYGIHTFHACRLFPAISKITYRAHGPRVSMETAQSVARFPQQFRLRNSDQSTERPKSSCRRIISSSSE